jgi:hypothetical protein
MAHCCTNQEAIFVFTQPRPNPVVDFGSAGDGYGALSGHPEMPAAAGVSFCQFHSSYFSA